MAIGVYQVKVTPELIAAYFTEGTIHQKHEILKGLPPDCKLFKVEVEERYVTFWFVPSNTEVKEQEIVVKQFYSEEE